MIPTDSRCCQRYVEIIEHVTDNIMDTDWVSIRPANVDLMSEYVDGIVKGRSGVTNRQSTIEPSVVSH